jgi:hypothetical protein
LGVRFFSGHDPEHRACAYSNKCYVSSMDESPKWTKAQ